MARRRAAKTVDELLAQARASLPHRPSPAEALQAQASGALLIDIREDDQRREDGLIPGAIVLPRNSLEWRCDPASESRHPPSPAGTCASSSSATRGTNPPWRRRRCSNLASSTLPTWTEDSPPGPRPGCR
jgi:rhodanese-related sulfurtransferase